MTFRTAPGASYEGSNEDGHHVFRVSIPLDTGGHVGRQCPSCGRLYRVSHEDYERLPDDLVLWCAYCGHKAPHDEFLTQQQQDRLLRVAQDAGVQMIGDALDNAFRSMSRRSSRNSLVRIKYQSQPFIPTPLPGINEEELIRERRCQTCQLRYAVFGEHCFCPVCGPLNPVDRCADALAAEVAKLDALRSVPRDATPALREKGVFDRLYVDTLSNVVGIVEAVTRDVFIARVQGADRLVGGKGNIFQRLDDLADLYVRYAGINLPMAAGVSWPSLKRLWAARHVHIHNGGFIDERYLRAVPDSPLRLGQRVVVGEPDARLAIAQASHLCDAVSTESTI